MRERERRGPRDMKRRREERRRREKRRKELRKSIVGRMRVPSYIDNFDNLTSSSSLTTTPAPTPTPTTVTAPSLSPSSPQLSPPRDLSPSHQYSEWLESQRFINPGEAPPHLYKSRRKSAKIGGKKKKSKKKKDESESESEGSVSDGGRDGQIVVNGQEIDSNVDVERGERREEEEKKEEEEEEERGEESKGEKSEERDGFEGRGRGRGGRGGRGRGRGREKERGREERKSAKELFCLKAPEIRFLLFPLFTFLHFLLSLSSHVVCE